VRTGVAVANTSPGPITVTVELRNLDGTLEDTGTIDIPASGHRALFLDEIAGLSGITPFQGVVRVTSASTVAVTALRSRINERQDFLITASAPKDESEFLTAQELFFPHLAIGGGFDMQFVLINPQTTGADSGVLRFVAPNGQPLPIRIP
jgi:hypothetical protein